MSGDVRTHDGNYDPKNIQDMRNLVKFEEALINRLDVDHKGFVTPEQLQAATKDSHLSKNEQTVAEIMLRTQDDLRYQRTGILPGITIEQPVMAFGRREHQARPDAVLDQPIQGADKSKNISHNDLKEFENALNRFDKGVEMAKTFPFTVADDILAKYGVGKGDDRKLMPSGVWQGVQELSSKQENFNKGLSKIDLTPLEKEELDLLKATQVQVRTQLQAIEAARSSASPRHAEVMELIADVPLDQLDLVNNASTVMHGWLGNPAINETFKVLHPEVKTDFRPEYFTGHRWSDEPIEDPTKVPARPLPRASEGGMAPAPADGGTLSPGSEPDSRTKKKTN